MLAISVAVTIRIGCPSSITSLYVMPPYYQICDLITEAAFGKAYCNSLSEMDTILSGIKLLFSFHIAGYTIISLFYKYKSSTVIFTIF